jgi:hypothetical protein
MPGTGSFESERGVIGEHTDSLEDILGSDGAKEMENASRKKKKYGKLSGIFACVSMISGGGDIGLMVSGYSPSLYLSFALVPIVSGIAWDHFGYRLRVNAAKEKYYKDIVEKDRQNRY